MSCPKMKRNVRGLGLESLDPETGALTTRPQRILKHSHIYSLSQRLHPFWLASRVATSGSVQFSEHTQSNLFVFSTNQICRRFVILDSEDAQSNGKSMNRGLPLLDLPRGRVS